MMEIGHKSVRMATNWKKQKTKQNKKQNDLFESVSTFSSGGSPDLSWNENFYQLILSALSKIVIKHQNASVRDNIYNAHVGFREWE